jgi:hypothetical protein
MILGMSTETFTLLHVLISLAGISTGFVVVFGMTKAKTLPRWTATFLITTALTSVTGFLFLIAKLTPGLVVGILSMVVLAVATGALYAFRLAGAWRWIYVFAATLALYFNVFVLIVQSFQKIAPLHALAPTGKEPAFNIAQFLTLAIFIVLGIPAEKGFRPPVTAAAAKA